MLKYRGQYRVVYETDKRTGKPQEFCFIPCRLKRGSNICRHDDNTLNCYIPSAVTARNLLNEYPDIFEVFQIGEREASLLFPESILPKAAIILKVYIKGRNVSPRSKHNKRFI